MIKDLIEYFENKKILILGFGREGQSSYKLIRKYLDNQKLYIADQKLDFQNDFDFLEEDNNIACISGDNYLEHLDEYDIILKSPGISFAQIDITNIRKKIKSQLELVLEFFNFFTISYISI